MSVERGERDELSFSLKNKKKKHQKLEKRTLHRVEGGSVPSDAAADDDEVVVVLAAARGGGGRGLGDGGGAAGGGAALFFHFCFVLVVFFFSFGERSLQSLTFRLL